MADAEGSDPADSRPESKEEAREPSPEEIARLEEEQRLAQEELEREARLAREREEEEERQRLEEERKAAEAAVAEETANLWRRAGGQEVDCAIVWLHHQGDSEVGQQLILKSIQLPAAVGRVRWLWPRAPVAPCSLRGLAPTTQWFDVKEYPICRVVRGCPDRFREVEEPQDVDKAVCRVRAVVRALEAEGIPAERILLGGFGMGAAVAVQTVLRAERRFAGGVLCSGWIPCEEELKELMTEEGRSTEILWTHGARDVLIEPRLAAEQAKALKEAGIPVQFRIFPEAGFEQTREVLATVQSFISERLAAGSPAPEIPDEAQGAPVSSKGSKTEAGPGPVGAVTHLQ
eukprot:TRINITY_DN18178_c0_g2_i2.p1 TRINITY_DN18178_c0_g2~~TRINITY_DN18178_c0_g2_i2.p1  ORF type:complete len:354 (+),score=85.89 TRINITY_DN18178_c0_g2_i2:26-1063(+)